MSITRPPLLALTLGVVLLAGCSSARPEPEPAPTPASVSPALPDQDTAPPPPTTTPAPPRRTSPAPAPSPVVSTQSRPPAVDMSGVDRSTPDEVARATLGTWYSVDTAVDDSPTAAALRSTPLLSVDLHQRLEDNTSTSRTAEWRAWVRDGVRTTATVRLVREGLNPPRDTDTTAYRVVDIVQTPITRDGQTLEPIERAAYVALIRDAGGWVVDQVSQR